MILGFGEIMMRVAPAGKMRLRQALPGTMEITWGGGEANVCASLAMLGQRARYVTALPKTPITESLVATLRGLGIDTNHICYCAKGRLGIYFLETGANQRSSVVVYDREGSSISLAGPDDYNFAAALDGVTWVHLTGITPSLSEKAFHSTLTLAKLAKERGVHMSFDLNFRKKLWRWKSGVKPNELANQCAQQILPLTDLVIGNEEDCAEVLGIHAEGTSVESGKLNAQAYIDVARRVVKMFPNVGKVAITLRESISADHNNWGAMLFEAKPGRAFFAPLAADGTYQPYEIRNIVDRVGAGDSFGAGLIFALNSDKYKEPEAALRFAVAASCLKHSISGDFNYATEDEIVALMQGAASGRVRR